MNNNDTYQLPLQELFVLLKAHGHTMPVSDIIEIEKLLAAGYVANNADEGSQERLASIITLMIAKNVTEQQRVYNLILRYFTERRKAELRHNEALPIEPPVKNDAGTIRNSVWYYIIGALAILLPFLIPLLPGQERSVNIMPRKPTSTYTAGDSATFDAAILPVKAEKFVRWIIYNDTIETRGSEFSVRLREGRYRVRLYAQLLDSNKNVIASDDLFLFVLPATSKRMMAGFGITGTGPLNLILQQDNASASFDYPYLVIILVLIFLFQILVLDHDKKSMGLLRMPVSNIPWALNSEAPYLLQMPAMHNQVDGERVSSIGTLLRKRHETGQHEFNLLKSINKTARNAGFMSYEYSSTKRPHEYLMLLDKSSTGNHIASLFEWFTSRLHDEGVHCNRYAFNGNPGWLSDEAGNAVRLDYLATEKSDHILLVFGGDSFFGNADLLLHAGITETFLAWETRVVVTPAPLLDWSFAELRLINEGFIVVPAEIEAMEWLATKLTSDAPAEQVNIRRRIENNYSVSLYDFNDIEQLREYLADDHIFKWIASLAVYPKLNWNISVSIGKAMADRVLNKKLVIDYNTLLKVSRIKWLHEGAMTNELRLALLKSLDKQTHALARAQIMKMLEEVKDSLINDSMAFTEWKTQYIINGFFLYTYDPVKYKRYKSTVSEMRGIWSYVTDKPQRMLTDEGNNNLMPRNEELNRYQTVGEYDESAHFGMSPGMLIVIGVLFVITIIVPAVIHLFSRQPSTNNLYSVHISMSDSCNSRNDSIRVIYWPYNGDDSLSYLLTDRNSFTNFLIEDNLLNGTILLEGRNWQTQFDVLFSSTDNIISCESIPPE